MTLRDGAVRTGASISVNLNKFGWEILETRASGSLTGSGYAELWCSGNVDSQVLYTFYDHLGLKIAEAPTFAQSPAGYRMAQVLIDQRQGQRLGIAVANAMDRTASLRLIISNLSGGIVVDVPFTVTARSVLSRFVDEWAPGLPVNFAGKVIIRADDPARADEFHATGLSFTGSTFTAIPVVPCDFNVAAPLTECREQP